MAWWRRDPSLYIRSPIHRYAQRVPRDHEAALRTRCFSRTPSKGAQHEDERGEKRPPDLSDLEWMQLKHYNRWRKRMQEGPYKAIFGASNDMLNGKGLIDWEWINKSFPKWMLNEVDVNEQPHGKRDPSAREPIFPQPSFRKQPLDRDGIKSPSDSRRPRDDSYVKVVGKAPSDPPIEDSASHKGDTSAAPDSIDRSSTFAPSDFASSIARTDPQYMGQKEETANTSKGGITDPVEPREHGDATQPSRGFALRDGRPDEFYQQLHRAELDYWKSQTHQDQQKLESDWRLTALQRRLRIPASARKQLSLDDERPGYPPLNPKTVTSEGADGKAKGAPAGVRTSTNAPEQGASSALLKSSVEEGSSSSRPTSEKLKQLPEDDIDFLSAADIRAAMGFRRAWLPTDAQKQASRRSLERAFNGDEETASVHSTMEAKIMNSQSVRGTEREMHDEQLAKEKAAENLETPSVVEPVPEPPAEVSVQAPAESSIERMKRWLETTGASFAKTFWQDPTEEADVTKTKLFFDKVAHYVKKGQAANRQITEDLEKDIPVSKALLSRLKSDEERLDLAIHRLRQRTSSGQTQDLSPRKIRAMESLKARFHQTNRELETAYEALRGLVGTDALANATPSFKRRLTTASKVLHKNSQLLRMLIWSLQTRLEDPKINRKILPNYKVVADNLLSLRDTQMTLMRLVDRAMLVYGVVPAGREDNNTPKIKLEDFENCEDPFVRARLAADVHLINEIKAHKSRSQETSNDNSSAAPKPIKSKVLDETSPLMNSLFRPFGPVIENLGNKELRELAAEKALLEEKRKLGDVKLVDEIKAAYEDTYGAITADHRQTSSGTPEVKEYTYERSDPAAEQKAFADYEKELAGYKESFEKIAVQFNMLKEDPSSTLGSSKETGAGGAPSPRPTELFFPDPRPMSERSAALGYPPLEKLIKDATATLSEGTKAAAEQPIKDTVTAESTQSQSQSETASSAAASTSDTSSEEVQQAEEQTETSPVSAVEHLPTHYTIVVREPETDTLSITTSTTGPPRDTSPAVPLHLALSSLDNPAKFIPYITEGLEVVSAKKDIFVLRDAIDDSRSTRTFSTVAPSASATGGDFRVFNHGATNPIDGTTRLSPTGYVGPEESAEQLEKDFLERRDAALKFQNIKGSEYERDQFAAHHMAAKHGEAQRRARAGSVVKTAIWVAGMCYVAGVIGEICT